MGYAEIERPDSMTVIRIVDGEWIRGTKQLCDAEGKYRSPFDGGSPDGELWFCAKCYAEYLSRRREAMGEKP
jgi:hypothetical protein